MEKKEACGTVEQTSRAYPHGLCWDTPACSSWVSFFDCAAPRCATWLAPKRPHNKLCATAPHEFRHLSSNLVTELFLRFFFVDILIFVGFCLLSEAFIIHPISPLKLNTSQTLKQHDLRQDLFRGLPSVSSSCGVLGWSPSIMGSKTPGVRKRYEIISVSYVIICYCISYLRIVVCKKNML